MNFDLFSSKQLPHQCVDSTSTNASLVELDGVAWLRLPGVGWHWLANSLGNISIFCLESTYAGNKKKTKELG